MKIQNVIKPTCLLAALFLIAVPCSRADDNAATSSTESKSKESEPNAELLARAKKGEAEAQYNLALLYLAGDGVEKDAGTAVKWLKLAAEQGLPKAQYGLGVRYNKGEGVEKDPAQAAKWFRRAACQNLPQAQYSLGIRYVEGKGVPQDYLEAYKWFTIAVNNGKEPAAKCLGNIEQMKLLTAEQIDEAKTRAAEFVPKTSSR